MSEDVEAAVEDGGGDLSEEQFGKIAADRLSEMIGVSSPADATPAAEVDAPVEVEVEDAVDAADVKVDETGRAHDPATGKFVAKPKDDDDTDTVDTSAAEAKYQTPEEAYKAATEAQTLIGKHAQRIRDAEQQAADAIARAEALEQQMQALQAGVEQRLTVSPEEIEALIEDDPQKAAHVAAAQGDPTAMERALKAWAAEGAEESYEAAVFRNRVENGWRDYKRAQEAAAAQQAAPAANGAALTADNEPVAAVIKEYAADIEAHMPAISGVLTEIPTLKQALQYGEPQQQADALRSAYLIAKSRHIDDTSASAITEATARAAEEAQQARADAHVVSASQGSASSADQPTFADDTKRGFLEAARQMGYMQPDAA